MEISLEEIFDRFEIQLRGKAHGWGARVYCIVYDKLEETYLKIKGARSYREFSSVEAAICGIKEMLKEKYT